jgi:quinol-cytochrome oxidoreductase complex cytochrome b subunit
MGRGRTPKLSAQVALLALTGLWLVLFYRPSSPGAWATIATARRVATASDGVRLVHRLVAFAAGPTSLAAATLVIVDGRMRRPGWRRGRLALIVGPALPVLVAAAGFTGYLLPWDQLALWAVTVGTNMHGFRPAFGSNVRFVLIGGFEISKATLRRWFMVHVVVISLLLASALVIAWRPRRADPRAHDGAEPRPAAAL